LNVIIGFVVVFGSVLGGFIVAKGKIPTLIQPAEFMIILGAAIGSMLIGNPPSVLKDIMRTVLSLVKRNPYDKPAFQELLQMLYELMSRARREGLLSMEAHAEDPEQSDIFKRFPRFHSNHHARDFLADSLRVILFAVEPFTLDEIMQADLDGRHAETNRVVVSLTKVGDAMPGFGIVAAVLGVVITMAEAGGDTAMVGKHVAAALVGTFLGVLMAYGLFAPLAQASDARFKGEAQYMGCIRAAMFAMARGDDPMSATDFARRTLEPAVRVTFSEMETVVKGGAGAGGAAGGGGG